MVPGRSKVLSVMFSRLIPAAQDTLVLPWCLTATCSLMTIIRIHCHQWQCGRSSGSLDLHLRLVRSKGFLQFVWTNPNLFKKQHLNHAEKWGFFSDLKSSPRTCVPQSPSLKRLFSSKCIQTGNIQIIVALCHEVYLNLTLVLTSSALGSRYHYYPYFQRETSWHKEVKSLTLGHPLRNGRAYLLPQSAWVQNLRIDNTEKLIFVDNFTSSATDLLTLYIAIILKHGL